MTHANDTSPPAGDVVKAAWNAAKSLVNLIAGLVWHLWFAVAVLNAIAELFGVAFLPSLAPLTLACVLWLMARDWRAQQAPAQETLPAAPTYRAIIRQEIERAQAEDAKTFARRVRSVVSEVTQRGRI